MRKYEKQLIKIGKLSVNGLRSFYTLSRGRCPTLRCDPPIGYPAKASLKRLCACFIMPLLPRV